MWPRAVEMMLGAGLALTPFIFLHDSGTAEVWANALFCALLILLASGLSFWKRTRRAHLLNIAVALWLVGYGYVMAGAPPQPVFQASMITGLVLGLFAFIPPDANQPPLSWRKHYEDRARALER